MTRTGAAKLIAGLDEERAGRLHHRTVWRDRLSPCKASAPGLFHLPLIAPCEPARRRRLQDTIPIRHSSVGPAAISTAARMSPRQRRHALELVVDSVVALARPRSNRQPRHAVVRLGGACADPASRASSARNHCGSLPGNLPSSRAGGRRSGWRGPAESSQSVSRAAATASLLRSPS